MGSTISFFLIHIKFIIIVVIVVLLKDKNKGHPGNTCVPNRKDHAGGKASCWWERFMLVGKIHVGGRSLIKFCKKKIRRTDPQCVRSQHKSQRSKLQYDVFSGPA